MADKKWTMPLWIIRLLGMKTQVTGACKNCAYYAQVDVLGNRFDVRTVGTCSNTKTAKEVYALGHTEFRYYTHEGLISFDPDFCCKNYKTKPNVEYTK